MMRKLGLIGGTGPESTIAYYKKIVFEVQKQTGSFPELVIESLSVFDVLHYCEMKDYSGLTDYLLHGIQCLADAGASFASLTGMTPHIVYDQLKEKSPLPIVSMPEAVSEQAKKGGIQRIGLLGTYTTMTGEFAKKDFMKNGIEVITPCETDMRYIEDKIEKELEFGKVQPETEREFRLIVDQMIRKDHIQALVLGCTELPLILNQSMFSIPLLDAMEIHIAELVSLITGKKSYEENK